MSRQSSLVSAKWLEEHLDLPDIVVVEIDEDPAAYDTGHIRGAVKLDWTTDLHDQVRRDVPSGEAFSALLSEKGVRNDDTIVLYGGNNNWIAAHAYWYFKLHNHLDVRLLDGGRKKWELERRALTKGTSTRVRSEYTTQVPDTSIRALRDEVLEGIDAKNLVDVRSIDEYAGRMLAPAHLPHEQADRPGHIPNAINVPWTRASNDDGTFKSNDDLTALYADAGLDWSREIITYGRIGERSAHTWFVLRELLEQPNVKNYPGSWHEYGSLVGAPVVLDADLAEPLPGAARAGYRPETLTVHAGQEEADSATNSRAVPIYQTTSYVFDDTEHAANLFSLSEPGNIYTRIMNPTQSVFEERMTQLEGGVGALATASGSAATTYAVLNLTYSGDNIVALSTLYGGTYALFAHTLPQFGIEVRFVDPERPDELARHVDEKTKLVFGETVGNPRLNVVDVEAWAAAAHELGLPLIIDNTAPTPFLCKPFELGADIIVHAATKYIGGHGTSIGGIIVDSGNFDWTAHANRFPGLTQPDSAYNGVVWTEAAGTLAYIIRARTVLLRNTGAAVAPLNSWLFLQGLETLHLRMERHSENALKVAEFLHGHDAVSWVSYPGLDADRYNTVARKTLKSERGYGGLVSFGLKSGREGGKTFVEALELFSHVANIGDTKSLAIHNATTTHSQLTSEELVKAGVSEDLVRLSIGIEHIEDIVADLDHALTASK